MITKGTNILIKYKNFSDKDLMYIIRLVNSEFNFELEKKVGKPKEGNLHAPLEITNVQTGSSITIDFTVNSDLIIAYLVYKTLDFVAEDFREVGHEMLQTAIRNAVEKFKKRRRKDNIEDFSYQ